MMRNTQQLGRWLMREVHGIDVPRKPVRKEHGGGPARNWKYKLWIRSLPCAICGLEPCGEAAHTGGDGGMAMKASDYSCIPLCPACHTFGLPDQHAVEFVQLFRWDDVSLFSLRGFGECARKDRPGGGPETSSRAGGAGTFGI
jgi:hypothetical protein